MFVIRAGDRCVWAPISGAFARHERRRQPGESTTDAHDRLDGVTRPRPSTGPAWPVRSTCPGSSSEPSRPPRAARGQATGAPAGDRDHRGQLRSRGAGPVRRGAGRGAVVVTAQRRLRRSWSRRWAAWPPRTRQVVAGDGQRRRCAQGGADIRCPGRADRGGFGRRAADVELPRHAAAEQLRRWMDSLLSRPPESSRGPSGSEQPSRSIQSWRRPASSSTPAISTPRRGRIRRSWTPIRPAPKPRVRCVRSSSSRARPRSGRMPSRSPMPRPTTSRRRSRPPTCRS